MSDGINMPVPFAANDTLLGGAGDDVLRQSRGNDVIDGGAGFDRLEFVGNGIAYGGVFGVNVDLGAGTSDADAGGVDSVNGAGGDVATVSGIEYVLGTTGNDRLTGDAFANRLEGQGGNDVIDGGAGSDLLDLSDGTAGINFTLSQGTNFGTFWSDRCPARPWQRFVHEHRRRYRHQFQRHTHRQQRERCQGRRRGGLLVGGAGTDTLLYDDSPTRVIVNMFTTTTVTIGGVSVTPGTASDGFGSTDTISGFENVIGSAFNDYIQGATNVANRLEGGAGNDTLAGSGSGDATPGTMDDTLLGGAGDDVLRQTRGHDSIEGGAGFDRLEFVSNGIFYGGGVGVSVNLGAGTSDADPFNGDAVNGPGGDVATVSGIEHVLGTAGTDSLTGDAFANLLEGGAGDDTLQGGGGNDTLDGGASGAGGGDRIAFLDATGGINFTLVQSSSDTVVDLSSLGLGTDTYRNIEGVIGTQLQ